MSIRNTFSAMALGILALGALPVSAHSDVQSSVEVQTSTFDLASADGQRALNAELKRAVRDVCGVYPPLRDLHEVRDHRSCVATAQASFQEDHRTVVAEAKAEDATRMAIEEQNSASTNG